MKIVCDACQAKYSIGDDKVQGKVFKIRCKKCSNIIVVRGNAAAEPAPAPQEKDTRVYDYGYDAGGGGAAAPAGDDAVWHLVINQDQVGPMSVAEVQQRFSAGEIDGETFAWREGFADWLPLSQVDVFASFAAGGGGGVAAHHDAGGAAAAISSRGRSHADDGGGGDLFGSSKPAAAATSASSGSKLRGERNENSVLFSLNNLAQLASDKPAPVAAASPGHATGAAGGEGSGLIDIRSMASAYMGSSGGGASMGKPATASSIGSIDDLPVFGGGGFSEPAVIVPVANRGRDNKLLYLMIGAVALLAVVAVIMVVILMKGGNNNKSNPQVAANDTKSDSDKAKDSTDKDKPAADKDSGSAAVAAATPTPAAPTPAAPAPTPTAATPPAPAPAPAHESAPSHSSHASHSSNTVASASHTPKSEPPPPAAPKDSGGGGNCDEVSCLVGNGGACCARYSHKGGGGGGGGGGNSNLPDALDRDMIQGGVSAVHGRVAACGSKFPGVSGKVKIHVKVGGDGRVSNASVETSPDPGLGSCVQSALAHASFPKTQAGGSFGYPFVFPM